MVLPFCECVAVCVQSPFGIFRDGEIYHLLAQTPFVHFSRCQQFLCRRPYVYSYLKLIEKMFGADFKWFVCLSRQDTAGQKEKPESPQAGINPALNSGERGS